MFPVSWSSEPSHPRLWHHIKRLGIRVGTRVCGVNAGHICEQTSKQKSTNSPKTRRDTTNFVAWERILENLKFGSSLSGASLKWETCGVFGAQVLIHTGNRGISQLLQIRLTWNLRIHPLEKENWLVVSTHLKNMSQNGNLPPK